MTNDELLVTLQAWDAEASPGKRAALLTALAHCVLPLVKALVEIAPITQAVPPSQQRIALDLVAECVEALGKTTRVSE